MTSITLDQAQRELPQVIADVLAKAEPLMVVIATGEQVVVMRLADFNSWTETASMLSKDDNVVHL